LTVAKVKKSGDVSVGNVGFKHTESGRKDEKQSWEGDADYIASLSALCIPKTVRFGA